MISRRRKKRKQRIFKLWFYILGICVGIGIVAVGYVFLPVVIEKFFVQKDKETIITPYQISNDTQDLGKLLNSNSIQFNQIQSATESPTLIVHLVPHGYVYIDSTKDLESQIKLLTALLERIGIEDKNKKIQYIDMRFEKAIVKFE